MCESNRDSRSPDSSSMNSPQHLRSANSSPPLRCSVVGLGISSSVSSPASSIGSPFSVISSSMGSPTLPSAHGLGYGSVSSPQVNSTMNMSGTHTVSSSDDIQLSLGTSQGFPYAAGTTTSSLRRVCSICGDRSSGEIGSRVSIVARRLKDDQILSISSTGLAFIASHPLRETRSKSHELGVGLPGNRYTLSGHSQGDRCKLNLDNPVGAALGSPLLFNSVYDPSPFPALKAGFGQRHYHGMEGRQQDNSAGSVQAQYTDMLEKVRKEGQKQGARERRQRSFPWGYRSRWSVDRGVWGPEELLPGPERDETEGELCGWEGWMLTVLDRHLNMQRIEQEAAFEVEIGHCVVPVLRYVVCFLEIDGVHGELMPFLCLNKFDAHFNLTGQVWLSSSKMQDRYFPGVAEKLADLPMFHSQWIVPRFLQAFCCLCQKAVLGCRPRRKGLTNLAHLYPWTLIDLMSPAPGICTQSWPLFWYPLVLAPVLVAPMESRHLLNSARDHRVNMQCVCHQIDVVSRVLADAEPQATVIRRVITAIKPNDPVTNICQAADKQLFTLVEWAKRIPHFSDLPLDDQVILLRAGWNELLIASFSHRSITVKDGILLATGLHVHRNSAHSAGVGAIFDRVLTELVSKMRDMQMDKSELGCLRAIILFNPDAKGLTNPADVEVLREKVYASLESYCKQKYPDQLGRFAKLLLRLPALRSIGLKCLEHLFFFKLIGDTPIDTFLMEMLEAPHQLS
ncbi:retinoic acid receptor RXR-beta-A-like [Narcine bancroftii]|uniref:retinoic acid receptor RXR-beta-A-like n=1 Tax=Narcine bancroftii TaxID=1343680 RepID=UPI0038317588